MHSGGRRRRVGYAARILCVLSLVGCGSRGAVADSSAAVSADAPIADFRATLERKPCFGTCPVYRVSVTGDGAVLFEGVQHVDSIGRFTGRIDRERVAALSRLFEEQNYYALADKYAYGEATCREYAADAPTVITSVATTDRSKQVEHDLGCFNVPTRLSDLERRIDELVGTARWIGR